MTTILKCKICGGDLDTVSKDIAVCQYCGSKQILPKMTSEKKANLYDRANHYRSINEFDKASVVYEQALAEDDSDAEVYWDLVLCRYGVEYVEDPRTKKRIPTVNRTQFKSIFDDRNYLSAIEHASDKQREIIKADAELIDRIQKGILDISNKEQPYDIFICYKESDDNGMRTPDSVIAQDIYNELTKEGYKVFFSRITLEDKLGSAYEPYIFAALNSAKVMIAVGTKPEYFNAVWVKNEWSRYLGLINAGEKKTLIPAYKDMDPYDLPEEFSHLQAQDMGKLGFMQDLIRGIGKIIEPIKSVQTPVVAAIDVEAYKKRIDVFLENGDFENAKEYCDKVLDVQPEDAGTYIQKLCAEVSSKKREGLKDIKHSYENMASYQNAMKFGTEEEKKELQSYLDQVKENENIEKMRKKKAMRMVSFAIFAAAVIGIVIGVINVSNRANRMLSNAEKLANAGKFSEAYEGLYDKDKAKEKNPELYDYIVAGNEYQKGNYTEAKALFEKNPDYKDSQLYSHNAEYFELEDNWDNMDVNEARKAVESLLEAGVEDTNGLKEKIDCANKEELFNKEYSERDYSSCRSILNKWKEEYPERANDFVSENQDTWYNDFVSSYKECLNSKDPYYKYQSLEILLELIDTDYKDVEDIYKICKSSSTKELFKYLDKPIAVSKLWSMYQSWLKGTWKTTDGVKYFSLDGGGNTSYNLPWFDSPNTYYGIDADGKYYLYEQDDKTWPPKSRQDLFGFEIISENQIKVTCYQNNSTYMLYKQ